MVQNEWGRVFPFQNIRIFENRTTKNNFASILKIFHITNYLVNHVIKLLSKSRYTVK